MKVAVAGVAVGWDVDAGVFGHDVVERLDGLGHLRRRDRHVVGEHYRDLVRLEARQRRDHGLAAFLDFAYSRRVVGVVEPDRAGLLADLGHRFDLVLDRGRVAVYGDEEDGLHLG